MSPHPSAATRRSVSDIKSSFEQKKNITTPAATPTSVTANTMSSTKRASPTKKPAQPSIDAVLDRTAIPSASTPSHASVKPSWIGPKPPERMPSPGPPVMKHEVHIMYTSPGLRPPVFIATSLTDPPWEPVEMEPVQMVSGSYNFWKEFIAEEGEYQYKLRLGPGDWWVCDETKPKVDDGAGNENNLIVVKNEGLMVPIMPDVEPLERFHEHGAPLLPHEMLVPPDRKPAVPYLPDSTLPESEREPPGPLLPHEKFDYLKPKKGSSQEDEPRSSSFDTFPNPDPDGAPLFRHETLTPPDPEEVQRQYRLNGDPERPRPSDFPIIPEEPDLNDPALMNDPSVIIMPTDKAGILALLEKIFIRRALEQAGFEDPLLNEEIRLAGRKSSASVAPALPSLAEDEEEEEEQEETKGNIGEIPEVRIFEPVNDDSAVSPLTPAPTFDVQDDNANDQSSTSPEESEYWKAKGKKKANQAGNSGLSAVAVGIAFTAAAAAIAFALWILPVGKGGSSTV